ncbi:RecQ family ATP-dependent DNA helicase [Chitinophaga nivalis]|uniref:ATP-dependent DNA helicase RecQ n=1 Tax=Chitinophaga nivalis TaxID=2991709 RepID=A0ABT3IXH2_9BACT|nr:ATP-dependent DNA helicase RecQ [Chitinophaga nivalis]MCW3461884.1 RecQ family ATP-dependent DNA helicase [Chitinophaga nivalis]MCW3488425.1 RecQ family ATP-dependent DNA helicase [Chitinophaga nivalis]
MHTPVEILQQYWGYNQFRPLQEDIVNAILAGRDTLALLPTGGGKSICFQVPAMMKPGLCLVVTPLIALMKDQVANLKKRGITAYSIYSGMLYKDVERVLEAARRGGCKFLYVSPERLQSKLFQTYCDGLPVNLIAVDEAHCISQWGYDFRPAYLQIADIRSFFPDTPVLALTASATPKVQTDICEKLLMQEAQVFTKSFTRANLSYSVLEETTKIDKVKHILDRVPGCGIVYCRNRKRTKEIASLLQLQGISAGYYHAGLPPAERAARQEAWINDEIRIMVCTNAFGMGIDKPDVRIVVHYDLPDGPEAYYQEAGRAGRDEQKAYAVLLYNETELAEMHERIALQFPTLDQIREVYQGIVNYLQVPVGSAEGVYFDFDINDFARTFQVNLTIAYSAIRILEQEGVLQLSESVFLPSRASFVTNKESLYEFENAYPVLEEIIKTLLRTYEGIFDTTVPVYERQIGRIMLMEDDDIAAQLQQLHQYGIIRYEPRREEPQLCFLQERVSAPQLRINMTRVALRKKVYTDRLEAMFNYVRNRDTCRTQQLVAYFGEKDSTPCGVCDICLKKKAAPLDAVAFKRIADTVVALLATQSLLLADLQTKMPDVKRNDLLEVLQFLQEEGRVKSNETGSLYL